VSDSGNDADGADDEAPPRSPLAGVVYTADDA